MDISFDCPHCSVNLTVDDSMAGAQLDCPKCHGPLTIPAAGAAPVAPVVPPAEGVGGAAAAAPVREAKHLVVPQRDRKKPEILVRTPVKSLELAAKQGSGNLRVKTFRRAECVEAGKDAFDAVVGHFLNEVGEGNIVRLEPIQYGRQDPGTGHWVPDYGLLVVYRG
ncbi:MAG: hypothetical protein RJA22_1909 [Verrucomicrobiota bacterium]|jgi:hypothetical protein